MNRYRVCVHSYVVVEADNEKQAKARAELAVRKAVDHAYLTMDVATNRPLFGDGIERFGYVAKGKPERLTDDD